MKTIGAALAAFLLAGLLATPAPAAPAASAATPPASAAPRDWNQPPASWDAASERPHYASVPGVETNRLIQGAGREWRQLRNGPLTQAGGWLLALVVAALAAIYLVKGPIRLRASPTGRRIERFNALERAIHWTVAITFLGLAVTGLLLFFGKHLLLPWLGYTAFSWLTVAAKNIHNFVGPLFIVSLAAMFLAYVKDNLIGAADIAWIRRFGGLFGGQEVPSGRFNGMQKLWFWGGIGVLGTAVSVTGLILDFPNWNQGRALMQQASLVHALAALLFIAASLAHIYMGTLGTEGAYRAMRDGEVDESWARQHHALWYEEARKPAVAAVKRRPAAASPARP